MLNNKQGNMGIILEGILEMTQIFRGKRTLIVDSAKVNCPISGQCDVDIERCFLCPHLVDYHSEEPIPSIICRTPLHSPWPFQ
jgi:hypothetical protein